MGVEKPQLSPCPSEILGEPTSSPSAAMLCRWERFSKENHIMRTWELFRLRDTSPWASSSGIFNFSPPPSPSPSDNGQKSILGEKDPERTQQAQINAQQHLKSLLHWTSCSLLPRHAHGLIHKLLDRHGVYKHQVTFWAHHTVPLRAGCRFFSDFLFKHPTPPPKIYNHCKRAPHTQLGTAGTEQWVRDNEQTCISYVQVGQGGVTDCAQWEHSAHKDGQKARGDSQFLVLGTAASALRKALLGGIH